MKVSGGASVTTVVSWRSSWSMAHTPLTPINNVTLTFKSKVDQVVRWDTLILKDWIQQNNMASCLIIHIWSYKITRKNSTKDSITIVHGNVFKRTLNLQVIAFMFNIFLIHETLPLSFHMKLFVTFTLTITHPLHLPNFEWVSISLILNEIYICLMIQNFTLILSESPVLSQSQGLASSYREKKKHCQSKQTGIFKPKANQPTCQWPYI